MPIKKIPIIDVNTGEIKQIVDSWKKGSPPKPRTIVQLKRMYPIQKQPNLSRATKYGKFAEDAFSVLADAGQPYETLNIIYFPEYDVFMGMFSVHRFSIPTVTFYARNEKAYQKFHKELKKPTLEKLWRR